MQINLEYSLKVERWENESEENYKVRLRSFVHRCIEDSPQAAKFLTIQGEPSQAGVWTNCLKELKAFSRHYSKIQFSLTKYKQGANHKRVFIIKNNQCSPGEVIEVRETSLDERLQWVIDQYPDIEAQAGGDFGSAEHQAHIRANYRSCLQRGEGNQADLLLCILRYVAARQIIPTANTVARINELTKNNKLCQEII